MIEYVENKTGHYKRYSIDSSKIEKEVGWNPTYSFDSALENTVQWYLDNEDWWKPLVNEATLHSQPWTLNWK